MLIRGSRIEASVLYPWPKLCDTKLRNYKESESTKAKSMDGGKAGSNGLGEE